MAIRAIERKEMARTQQYSSRSQSVRERRSKTNSQPAKNARASHEITTQGLPPVMVRGGGYTTSQARKPKRKAKNVKRRFDVALATPGVEIRLPSIPAVRLGWRIVSFGMVAGLVALLSHLLRSPLYQVQMVDIQGAVRLTSEDINRSLNIYNKSVFDLMPEQMVETLQSTYPELKEVSVQIGLPAKVMVTLDERVPLINWVEASSVQWVDAEGFAFAPRGEAESLVTVDAHDSPEIPVQIEGDGASLGSFVAPKVFLPTDLVQAVLTLGPQVPEGRNIVYDSLHGLGWNDVRGWDVYFGMDVADLQEKLLVYSAIVEQLQAEGLTPALINVEHIHAPFYRLER
jgi:hypothetical protein